MSGTLGNLPQPLISPEASWDYDGDDRKRWMSVGEVMVLKKCYAPEQLWLPFMAGTIFNTDEPFEEQFSFTGASFERRMTWKYESPPPQIGIPQYVLPFRETKIIQGSELFITKAARWVTFDRSSGGHLLDFGCSWRIIERVMEWCRDNCAMRVARDGPRLLFESADDHLLATMRWGGEQD